MPFYNNIPSKSNIVISFKDNPIADFGMFAKGYHEAANQLSNAFLSKSYYGDYEGYPIVFLYRHAFELYLKHIIYWSMRLCAFNNINLASSKLVLNHKLVGLSAQVENLLLVLFDNDPDILRIVKDVNQIAKEFYEIDQDSFSYRYPIDKKENHSTKKHQVVNIESVHINMNKILKDLEVINFGLDLETCQIEKIYDLLNEYFVN